MIVAEFVGGPLDGREQALETAPYRLVFPTLDRWDAALATFGTGDMYYVRRGPVLAEHALYDYEAGG